MPNQELFKKIHDQIEEYPETHNQSSWGCGTTKCVAGWAVHFRAVELGMPATGTLYDALDLVDPHRHYGALTNIDRTAAHLLEVDDEQADALFWSGDATAATLVARFAGVTD
jgi:hypothetical protein